MILSPSKLMTWTADVYCAVKKLFSHSHRDGDFRGGETGENVRSRGTTGLLHRADPGPEWGIISPRPGSGRGDAGRRVAECRWTARGQCGGPAASVLPGSILHFAATCGRRRPAIAGHSLQLTIHRPPRYLLHVDAAVLSPYRYTG